MCSCKAIERRRNLRNLLDCLREVRVLAHHMVLPFLTLCTRTQGAGGLPSEMLLDRLGMTRLAASGSGGPGASH